MYSIYISLAVALTTGIGWYLLDFWGGVFMAVVMFFVALLVTFAIIWTALAIFSADSIRTERALRRRIGSGPA